MMFIMFIVGRLWKAFRAQINKVVSIFWKMDPVAMMQYEVDAATEQLKSGRQGLEQARALVERVTSQVIGERQHVEQLDAKVKAYLAAGQREVAGKFALEVKRAKEKLTESETQLTMHEETYQNNVKKLKHANDRIKQAQIKVKDYEAKLNMSKAEAEVAKLAQSFDFDVTTDFGEAESIIQDQISLNRAKVKVAADLSTDGLAEIEQDEAVEASMADTALREYEIAHGFITPETADVPEASKMLGPAMTTEN